MITSRDRNDRKKKLEFSADVSQDPNSGNRVNGLTSTRKFWAGPNRGGKIIWSRPSSQPTFKKNWEKRAPRQKSAEGRKRKMHQAEIKTLRNSPQNGQKQFGRRENFAALQPKLRRGDKLSGWHKRLTGPQKGKLTAGKSRPILQDGFVTARNEANLEQRKEGIMANGVLGCEKRQV